MPLCGVCAASVAEVEALAQNQRRNQTLRITILAFPAEALCCAAVTLTLTRAPNASQSHLFLPRNCLTGFILRLKK